MKASAEILKLRPTHLLKQVRVGLVPEVSASVYSPRVYITLRNKKIKQSIIRARHVRCLARSSVRQTHAHCHQNYCFVRVCARHTVAGPPIQTEPNSATVARELDVWSIERAASQFGAAAVRFEGATLGRPFKKQRMSHVLVLSTQKSPRRRVGRDFGEFVDKRPCRRGFGWFDPANIELNWILERGDLLKLVMNENLERGGWLLSMLESWDSERTTLLNEVGLYESRWKRLEYMNS